MALEAATYISALDAANPASTDPKSQGDDHLRLIKSALKATLPGLSGAMTATHTELNFVAGVTSPIQSQLDGKGTVTLTGAQTLSNKTLVGYTEAVYALTGTTPVLSAANGATQTWTLTASSTPTDGLSTGQSLTLMINDGTAYTVTWPSVVWVGGVAPTLALTGYTVVELWKVGSVLYGALVGGVA